jgi:chromosome segregation ATPase
MKMKIVIVVLAVACVGLAIAFFATKKQSQEQHVADVTTILDLSNQVKSVSINNDDLKQVNLTLTNDLAMSQDQIVQLSNSLAAASATLAESQVSLASAQTQITNLSLHITDLEAENKALDQRTAELTNTIAQLNALIANTRQQLATSETNNAFLQQELQKQMAQKAEIEHKFNDLSALRQQVSKVKTELFIARRVQLMKNDNGQKRGAELLMTRNPIVTNSPNAAAYGLNVEVGSDGSVKVIPPLVAPTNAPAH